MPDHHDADNRSNWCDPNDDAYWESRGEDDRPEDRDERVADEQLGYTTYHLPSIEPRKPSIKSELGMPRPRALNGGTFLCARFPFQHSSWRHQHWGRK